MAIHVSKEGSPQIVMMLQLAEGVRVTQDGKSKIFFQFNGGVAGVEDKERATRERNSFKDYLAEVVNRNKTRAAGASPAPTPARTGSAAPSPAPRATPSGSATPARASRVPLKDAPPELEVRIRVLKANPSLAILHQDVVMSKQISDAEFWAHPTRKALLAAERSSMEQRQGRNARIADPRPSSNEQGEMKINMTAELVRDLKAQYPVVARAFEENVPSVMDEPSFWKRYFSSKLYHRLRTSARSQASQHTVQPDDILDKYLEEEDDGLEPRRLHNAHDAFLDLGATAEDHGETGNEKDYTMRAGAERRTLPLMRRFNDHSQSLLDSALGEQDDAARKRKRAEAGMQGGVKPGEADSDEDDGLVIDELQSEDHRKRRRLLDMREQRSLFASSGGESAADSNSSQKRSTDGAQSGREEVLVVDSGALRDMIEKAMQDWPKSGIADGAGEKRSKDSDGAMAAMLGNIHARREAKSWRARGDLPDSVLKPLVSMHGASTEFLRQLWAAVAPQPLQDGTLATTMASSAVQRKARAQRMLASLRASLQRFDDAISNAEDAQRGVGQQRVSVVRMLSVVN